MKLYKLTDQRYRTRGETLWGEGATHTAPGGALCSDEVVHAYRSPLLAVLLNPIHARIGDPILWDADGDVCVDDGLNVGCTRLTTLRQIPLPEITPAQRVRFAIYCALEVYDDPSFRAWAERWLDGTDRSQESASAAWTARTAASAASAASVAAESAAAAAAKSAAKPAAWAKPAAKPAAWAKPAAKPAAWAKPAAKPAAWVVAKSAAKPVAWAVAKSAAKPAALAVAGAAELARDARPDLDFVALAGRAIADEGGQNP